MSERCKLKKSSSLSENSIPFCRMRSIRAAGARDAPCRELGLPERERERS